MNVKEHLSGAFLLLFSLVLGGLLLNPEIFFRLVIGLGLGYALTRSSIGFAGSVNRAYRAGTTKLLRALMLMFTLAALTTSAFLYNHNPQDMGLWINPINAGLLVGGLLFGFGMSFASCCASGVLTYFSSSLNRPALVLLSFGGGVFLGFPLQAEQSWIRETWVSSSTYQGKGVFLPDLFAGTPLDGYLGAILLTAGLASLVVWFAHRYERQRRLQGTYIGNAAEKEQAENTPYDFAAYPFFSSQTYQALFVRRWSLTTGVAVIVILFTLLMGVTGSGWGASTPFGLWFGRLLIATGIDPSLIAEFTHRPEQAFTMPFFEHPVNVQNIGIMLGSITCLLLSGRFISGISRLRLSGKEASMLIVAGLSMGLGTRLANGCNVGALFTPIANFSLSGWIFLVVMIMGGVLGNQLGKRIS
ncbi:MULTISPECIES: YeeE/YedE thiosulfate transporter family protein [unclassified Vibrio]|uniref:YeeE/YedE thiosulfate transporter family protein n=1 Tax=Vibrio sp. HB236076 TaxID=3232307 RepID=A0AB39HG82_9VIBR|nr:YeeE/YedE thiosulfate transporter family protein [Vibrio sp. HB161653]MDP5255572.1 YeeE/YedE thiosulfate transporter family protein [Vibrio sp. HB161653]